MKTSSLNNKKPLLTGILTGFLCNCIWLYEILHSKGWTGLQWLDGHMISVFIIIPIIVFSFIYSLNLSKKLSCKAFLISIFALSIISLISFEIARVALYSLYSGFHFIVLSIFVSILIDLLAITIPILIFSLGYYALINRLITKIPKKVILLFVATIIFSVIAGLVTVVIFPGFGNGKSFIDSVKMGYPIFWLNISFGIISIIISNFRGF